VFLGDGLETWRCTAWNHAERFNSRKDSTHGWPAV